MPLFKQIDEAGISIGVWQVTESVSELTTQLSIDSYSGERYASFTSDARKLEFLAVRVLLKEMCGMEKQIAYYPSGRPYLKDRSASISISHTKGYVAVALHVDSLVGIDIEQLSDRVERIAKRFIRADEECNLPVVDRTKALLIYWSAKETVFKLLDEEGVDWRNHMQVHPFQLQREGSFELSEHKTSKNNKFRIRYYTHPEFVLTWGAY
ncbi:MAG: 4'-phosphopantetheinyl transferase family protein [Phocaeicola sp.]